jgi:sigma-B regulation protein RsbU (phosphoserine phosphatase)
MTAGIQLPGSDEMIRLQQQVAQLQALLEASRLVHSTVHEEEVLKQVLQIVVRELEMTGASFPSAHLSYGDQPTPGESGTGATPLSYPLDDREGHRMEELVVWPPEGRELSLFEDDFIQRLTQQAAVALENIRNHERNLAFALLEQDLDASRQIQRSRLPHALPAIDGYSLGYRSIACYHVGGDYLDIVEPPDGSLVMVVADVAGKGLASAIMSTSFRSAFRALAFSGIPLDELAARINHYHWSEGEEAQRRFVTAVFLRLQPKEGVIEVVNAGHNPGFLVQPGVAPYLFEASGVPLGLFSDVAYTKERREFKPGARLLVYTDGLTEFFKGEQEFGPERLLEAFTNCQADHADKILDAMWKAIADFSEGGQQRDDMTALALYREFTAEKPE